MQISFYVPGFKAPKWCIALPDKKYTFHRFWKRKKPNTLHGF
jgi:hypothetical protein